MSTPFGCHCKHLLQTAAVLMYMWLMQLKMWLGAEPHTDAPFQSARPSGGEELTIIAIIFVVTISSRISIIIIIQVCSCQGQTLVWPSALTPIGRRSLM